MSDDPAKKKDELLELIDAAAAEAKRIESNGKNLIQSARLVCDTAGPLHDLYSHVPVSGIPPNEWARQIQNVQSWLGVAKSMPPSDSEISTFIAMSQAAANTAVSGVMPIAHLNMFESIAGSAFPTSQSLVVHQARKKLFDTLERFPSQDKARAAIQRLGLDSRGGDSRTALESLEIARQSLDIPVMEDTGISVLISLRECINRCISELIRRRPQQEETKNWQKKIASLGRQCGLDGLDALHFDRLGTDAESMMDQLSVAKQHGLTRERVMELFHRGLLFLISLLDSIDASKVKPS